MPPDRGLEGISLVEILPIDPLEDGMAAILAARVSRHIEAACRVGRRPPAGRLLRWLPDRAEQADADALLAALEKMPAVDGAVRVGVTGADLAIPIFTFVFGRARHHGAAAVVSVARLRPEFYGLAPDPELLLRRAVDEVRHELGHVGGLKHCDDPLCLLHFAATVEAIDLRGHDLCRACASALPAGLRDRQTRQR
jgi:archaemetzincin